MYTSPRCPWGSTCSSPQTINAADGATVAYSMHDAVYRIESYHCLIPRLQFLEP
jgi:hypothetical protein